MLRELVNVSALKITRGEPVESARGAEAVIRLSHADGPEMRALLALGDGCRLRSRAPHDLRALCCRGESEPIALTAIRRQSLAAGTLESHREA